MRRSADVRLTEAEHIPYRVKRPHRPYGYWPTRAVFRLDVPFGVYCGIVWPLAEQENHKRWAASTPKDDVRYFPTMTDAAEWLVTSQPTTES